MVISGHAQSNNVREPIKKHRISNTNNWLLTNKQTNKQEEEEEEEEKEELWCLFCAIYSHLPTPNNIINNKKNTMIDYCKFISILSYTINELIWVQKEKL